MEDLALDGAPFEHPAFGVVELVEAHREQRPERWRHLDLSVFGRHREHLRDEQRVAARRVRDPRAQLRRDVVADHVVGLFRGQRLEPQRGRPRGAPLDQLRPRHTEEQQRSTGREQRRRLDQVEERLVTPLDVIEDTDERRLLLEQLAERPGDLVPARPDIRLAQQRTDRRSGDRLRRQNGQLLDHLHHRPVGDPFPVRQTATPHNPGSDRCQCLGDQARLTDTGVADHSQQLAARLSLRALPGLPDQRQLALAADEPGDA